MGKLVALALVASALALAATIGFTRVRPAATERTRAQPAAETAAAEAPPATAPVEHPALDALLRTLREGSRLEQARAARAAPARRRGRARDPGPRRVPLRRGVPTEPVR